MRRSVLLSALALAAAVPAPAQPPSAEAPAPPAARAEVLVLGVYHMANPGRDLFNMQADDVLAPGRQAEIAQLIEVLKRFRPTKVAVERDVWDQSVPRDFADYVAGKHELTRNEVEQIGFRLAKELSHETVYPVDSDGEFPFPRVVNYARASGRSKELEAIQAEVGAMVEAQDRYLASHTVLETLLYMNADDKVAGDVGFYYRQAHFGEPGDWAGADLVSDWFRRNMRIYSNVTRLVDSPKERVLAIFGAGHLGWLRHAVSSDPTLRLRKLAELIREGAASRPRGRPIVFSAAGAPPGTRAPEAGGGNFHFVEGAPPVREEVRRLARPLGRASSERSILPSHRSRS